MLVHYLLEPYTTHLQDGWRLDADQTIWWAAHVDEKPRRDRTIENTRMVPVTLPIARARKI